MWSLVGVVVAAAVTLIGVLFTRAQGARAERRLALETTVNGLKLLMASDGTRYAPQGVVAGAIATLVHLKHPVIAMRALGGCWRDGAIDVASATWVISEVFDQGDPQAQLEAASMLDAHAATLCADDPGALSWPAAIEFNWIPTAPLPARLRVIRAILRTLLSRSQQWWILGGRQGWAVALLHEAMRTDPDQDVKQHAATALDTLLSPLQASNLSEIQSANGWVEVQEIRRHVDHVQGRGDGDEPSRRQTKVIVMLQEDLKRLRTWASAASGAH